MAKEVANVTITAKHPAIAPGMTITIITTEGRIDPVVDLLKRLAAGQKAIPPSP